MTTPAVSGTQWAKRFEQHPVLTGALITVLLVLILAVIAEGVLRAYGLGHPILYQVNSEYGYRPQPNQLTYRIGGSRIRINNLGLRADQDWTQSRSDKILFLGNSVTYGGSYVSNDDLFAHIAPGGAWVDGDGGVNAWGVENICGLVIGTGFQPAQTYVSVLIEGDFYRGLNPKPPFFRTTKPVLALQEAIPHVVYMVKELLHPSPPNWAAKDAGIRARRAVRCLREMDDTLRSHGYTHLIYISPSKANLDGMPRDTLLRRLLDSAGVHVSWLQDRPELQHLTPTERAALYHDAVHLNKTGHALWGKIIGGDLRRLPRPIHNP